MPKNEVIVEDKIQKKGKPALVIMDMAQRMIQHDEMLNPQKRKLTEL